MAETRSKEVHVVGAAILEGCRCLVGLRRAGGSAGNTWEFPGGKVEPGERPEEALRREIQEELGIEIEVGELVGRGAAPGGERTIVLDVYFARRVGERSPRAHEHTELRWIEAHEFDELTWASADVFALEPVKNALTARTSEGSAPASSAISMTATGQPVTTEPSGLERAGLSRRHLIGGGTALALGALGLLGLGRRRTEMPTFGNLRKDPAGLFNLPPGFEYRVLGSTGMRMSDGQLRRDLPDGMAAFAGSEPGELILMLNHERSRNGGVSRLVVDEETLTVKRSNDVLTGTRRNCSGGPSPWGWLSCEEVDDGGVWLCPTSSERALEGTDRRRIDDYGTFRHEAVCIDPKQLTAYLTEDNGPSHIYRMVPNDQKDPLRGSLEVLCHESIPAFDTKSLRVGDGFAVRWRPVTPSAARRTAKEAAAAVFHRTEGIWFFDEQVYFTATTNDQLFCLETSGFVRLVATDLRGPDNVTVAPWGDVFVAEDHLGTCRIRVVDPEGNVSTFAENASGRGRELAGVSFSPSGRTLFVNLQTTGETLAVTGPFRAGRERV